MPFSFVNLTSVLSLLLKIFSNAYRLKLVLVSNYFYLGTFTLFYNGKKQRLHVSKIMLSLSFISLFCFRRSTVRLEWKNYYVRTQFESVECTV